MDHYSTRAESQLQPQSIQKSKLRWLVISLLLQTCFRESVLVLATRMEALIREVSLGFALK